MNRVTQAPRKAAAKLGGSDQNVASTRTTVNTTVLTVIVLVANRVFGWNITLEDLLPWMPVIVPVYFAAVRVSYYVAERYPQFAKVLFGIVKEPTYDGAPLPPPTPEA